MRFNERIRVAVLVVVLVVVGVVGEADGQHVAAIHNGPAMQAGSIGVVGEGDGTVMVAVWSLQVIGILLFEAWAFTGRRRMTRSKVHQSGSGPFSPFSSRS
jgi:hypothetical protein